MCDVFSAVTAIGGAILSSVLAPKPPKVEMPQAATAPQVAPNVQPPEPAPKAQAVKSPDRVGQQGTGQAGGAAGIAQTFLTGPGGVNLDDLKLGKNTLLGA